MALGMRRIVVIACLLAWTVAVPVASAHEDPFDHGPDSTAIDAGPEAPAPTGGPSGSTLRLSKRKRDLWRLSLRLTGEGRAQVDVRCRRSKAAKVSAVLIKRYKVPRTVRASVRCATKPAASARRVG